MTTVQEIVKSGCLKCGDRNNLRVIGKMTYAQDVFWNEKCQCVDWEELDMLDDSTADAVFCVACETETPVEGE